MQRPLHPSQGARIALTWKQQRRKFLLHAWLGALLLLAYEIGFGILLGKGIVYATARSYISTTGIVTGAYVAQRTTNGGRGSVYFVQMTFEYISNGTTYSGSNVGRFARSGGDRETAYALVKPYQAGSSVPVRFDPDDPSVSFADIGDDPNHVFLVWVGYLFVALLPFLSLAALWLRGDIYWPRFRDRD